MLVGQVHSENQKEVKQQNGKCQKKMCVAKKQQKQRELKGINHSLQKIESH